MKKWHWTILIAMSVLGAGLLWTFLVRTPIEEGRCRLVCKKAPSQSQLLGLACQFLEPLGGAPEDVRDLPADFDRPCYYQVKSAGRWISLVVNLSENPRLCVDTDGDGVLSEEQCFAAKAVRDISGGRSWHRFGPIPPISREDSGHVKGGFYVGCYSTDAPEPLAVFPDSFRTGTLCVSGRTYRVAVVDGDCDGLFRSALPLPLSRPWRLPESDVFAIDLNRNGVFDASTYPLPEMKPLARLVQIGSVYYAIDIAPDGRSLSLSLVEPQFGTLAIEPNDADIDVRLWSDAADQHLSSGRQWLLPAGKYKATFLDLKMADASGEVWTFTSILSSPYTHLGLLECFTIEPGETTPIRLGPPFTAKVDVQVTGAGMVSISPVLVGCAGEEYSAGVRQGRQSPSLPAFKIVDEKGTMLTADKFHYG